PNNRNGDNRLYAVYVFDGEVHIETGDDYSNKVIKFISFEYLGVQDGHGGIAAHIQYQDGSQDPVVRRDVEMRGLGHEIQSIVDYDKDGNMIVQSKFNYPTFTLESITRT